MPWNYCWNHLVGSVHGTHVHVYACVCNVNVCQTVIQPKLQPSLNKSGRNRHEIDLHQNQQYTIL